MADKELGETMREYDSVLQAIADARGRIRACTLALRRVEQSLVQDRRQGLDPNLGRKNREGSRDWKVSDDGGLIIGLGQDEPLPRDLIGQLSDTLEELAVACDRKDQIDDTLKQMGYASLVKNPRH